jgi:hypothetical protein
MAHVHMLSGKVFIDMHLMQLFVIFVQIKPVSQQQKRLTGFLQGIPAQCM